MKNTMRLHYEDLPVSQKPNALIIEFCTFKWWASNCHVVKCIYLEIIVPSCSVISEKSWFHYGKHYYYLFWWSSVEHKLKRCYIQISATHNCWKCKYGTRSNIHAKIACFAAFSNVLSIFILALQACCFFFEPMSLVRTSFKIFWKISSIDSPPSVPALMVFHIAILTQQLLTIGVTAVWHFATQVNCSFKIFQFQQSNRQHSGSGSHWARWQLWNWWQ